MQRPDPNHGSNKLNKWFPGIIDLIMPARYAIVGAVSLGLIGAAVGFIVGLVVHAPTAPFAAVEVGLPAALMGALTGLVLSLGVTLYRRLR